jgi:hypothetical protein
MKKFMIFCLLLALVLPGSAVEDGQILYFGGTAPGLAGGTVGRLDTTSETSLTFEYSGNKLAIPYAAVESYQYSTEVAHHLGVLPTVAVGLLKTREHRHFFRISYRDANSVSQVAVFEVPKHMPRTLQAVLEARAPGKAVYGAPSSLKDVNRPPARTAQSTAKPNDPPKDPKDKKDKDDKDNAPCVREAVPVPCAQP